MPGHHPAVAKPELDNHLAPSDAIIGHQFDALSERRDARLGETCRLAVLDAAVPIDQRCRDPVVGADLRLKAIRRNRPVAGQRNRQRVDGELYIFDLSGRKRGICKNLQASVQRRVDNNSAGVGLVARLSGLVLGETVTPVGTAVSAAAAVSRINQTCGSGVITSQLPIELDGVNQYRPERLEAASDQALAIRSPTCAVASPARSGRLRQPLGALLADAPGGRSGFFENTGHPGYLAL